jgi:hypothetical protein
MEILRGPQGFTLLFNVVDTINDLPSAGVTGVGYCIGPNLWV